MVCLDKVGSIKSVALGTVNGHYEVRWKYAWLLPLDLIPFVAVELRPNLITLIVFPSGPHGPETSLLSDGKC